MGSVFGKQTVAEPHFEVLLERAKGSVKTAYEIRRYGERYVAEASYTSDDDGSPFRLLASYIGVFGDPQNEGAESIDMTAPVMMQHNKKGGEAIAMTAPVMKSENERGEKTMQFVLPEKYDELSKIPKPTNPKVHIREIPPAVGAVHRYSGSMDDELCKAMAMALREQLKKDGVDLSEGYVMEEYQFWGYNPPFTLPMFRRNEVWIGLTNDQAKKLVEEFNPEGLN